MNIRNIKIRGAMLELDVETKKRMNQLMQLTSDHKFGQVNLPRFERYVEEAHKLVLEIEELRLAVNALVARAKNPTDVTGVPA